MLLPSTVSATRCVRHPERAGYAVCMSCSAQVCQECATTWDGINYCRQCLERRRGAVAGPGRWRQAVGVVVRVAALGGLFLVTARLMAWAISVLAGWWG